MSLPRYLPGRSGLEVWLSNLRAYAISSRPKDSPDIRWHNSPDGMTPTIIKGGGGEGGNVQRFKVASIADNWIVCRKVDSTGTESSTTDYKVMRPIMLRSDKALPTGANVGSLANTTNQDRTFTITTTGTPIKTVTVAQSVSPKYVAGDFIYGANEIEGGTVDDGSGSQVEWIDLNIDARRWEMDLKLVAVCISGSTTQYALAKISNPVA